MKKRDREKFHNMLIQIRKDLTRDIQQDIQEGREGEAGDGRDTYDIASDERDREISLLLGDRERKKLQQVDEALARVESGEYGECEECGGEISTGRLEAMPFSRLCVTCQSEFEQAQRTMQPDSTMAQPPRYPAGEGDEDAG